MILLHATICTYTCVYIYIYIYIYLYTHTYTYRERERDLHQQMYIYSTEIPVRPTAGAVIHMYTCSSSFFLGGVGCDSVSLYLQFPDPVARCLLRRWTGDPPETLNGLTSNPLSLMW